MDTGFLNSLVADYLTSVSSKLAEKFKKETKSAPLPEGSPRIAEMVKHFKENTPKASKRKLGMTNGDSAAKKAKKVRILKQNRWGLACILNTWYFFFYLGVGGALNLNFNERLAWNGLN